MKGIYKVDTFAMLENVLLINELITGAKNLRNYLLKMESFPCKWKLYKMRLNSHLMS